MLIAGFDWDDGNVEKCQKHGLAIADIEAAFRSAVLRIRPDVAHSQTETRFQAVGQTPAGRYVFLVFTLRGDHRELIRPISARYMHQQEVAAYEEAVSRLPE
jgi:uncharacterized DUF497 family protein